MRIKYIDVLKAFAIIAVVFYHAGIMTYGYLGVDVFLVIAGYLTTRSLYSKMTAFGALNGGGRFYLNFVLNRIIRLLPPLLVAGLFCMAMGFITMLPDDYENLSQSVIASSFFGNNILSAITTENYWDISNEYKPLMHTWYVGVVMQFYLVYPFLFVLSKFDKKYPKRTLLTIISSLAFISLLIYFATDNIAQRFYYLPSRFFEFAAGGIVALVYDPKENKPFGKSYVYVCYALMLALMFFNINVIPSIIRLVIVTALSCVLLCSMEVLENQLTGNSVLAKIGAASYSIFIWHQILLAFYRYSITNSFTIGSYVILLLGTTLLSWMSYCFVEQSINKILKNRKGKSVFYALAVILFILLNVYSFLVFQRAGVVRDVPELDISMSNIHRGMHAEYVDRAYKYEKPFGTNKPHWLVVGDSFGRDFVNVILESSISDSVEVSYVYLGHYKEKAYDEYFSNADRVFIATLGLDESTISDVEVKGMVNRLSPEKIIVVGEKNFGESNGQIYAKRKSSSYFLQRVRLGEKYMKKNDYLRTVYETRYCDLISLVVDEDGTVPVFTPDHHFISQDCSHFTRSGAVMFSKLIDWSKYLN